MTLHAVRTEATASDERLEVLIREARALGDKCALESHVRAGALIYEAMLELQRARRDCVAAQMDRERLERARAE